MCHQVYSQGVGIGVRVFVSLFTFPRDDTGGVGHTGCSGDRRDVLTSDVATCFPQDDGRRVEERV